MEKITLEESVKDLLINNFDKYSKYLDHEFQVFKELKKPVEEVAKCLMLDFHNAAICLTNNILVRLLKISLIYDEVGIKQVSIEKWNSVFSVPHQKYGSLLLGETIELCIKHELISKPEKDYLTDALKKLIINGYFNANPGKLPDESEPGNHNGVTELKKEEPKQKIIPALQSIQIEHFTKANASRYFEFVFELIGNIEYRLIERDCR